jgi:hypothetical protein
MLETHRLTTPSSPPYDSEPSQDAPYVDTYADTTTPAYDPLETPLSYAPDQYQSLSYYDSDPMQEEYSTTLTESYAPTDAPESYDLAPVAAPTPYSSSTTTVPSESGVPLPTSTSMAGVVPEVLPGEVSCANS